ncbi:putative 2-hydroxyisoflavanone dehydratase [Iris pallida]|uniref:2-hydroxyisoflavanone dehydratase n=1 Tax=Iris pallida TaxID=29817 RepID=A0AAX6I3Z4_IRIPA|nr:putative 2-hydroxyisoflavanone dehydratase [Iris pallida]KAJ6847798.1 putative 2-hydroxyisoflavanone dehydratase [Iris pallida]
MDPDNEVEADHMPFFRIYKSGRTERFEVIESCPPSVDAATGVSSKDTAILDQESKGLSARLYIPTSVLAEHSSSQSQQRRRLPVLVYYHGGAFCCGSAFAKDIHTYLNTLVAEANIVAVSVNYRLAPEHPIPAAYEDSWLALQWVLSHASATAESGAADGWIRDHADFEHVFLGGESAGANIAHHMAMRAGTTTAATVEHGVRVEGLVLFQPYFLQAEPTESDSIDTGMSSGLKSLWKIACPSSTDLDDDHRINPTADGAPSLSVLGCERVLVCVAERDTLRDRGRAYYERLRGCGWRGEAELYESQGEGHVFQVIKPTCDEARALTRKVGCFLNLADQTI